MTALGQRRRVVRFLEFSIVPSTSIVLPRPISSHSKPPDSDLDSRSSIQEIPVSWWGLYSKDGQRGFKGKDMIAGWRRGIVCRSRSVIQFYWSSFDKPKKGVFVPLGFCSFALLFLSFLSFLSFVLLFCPFVPLPLHVTHSLQHSAHPGPLQPAHT